MALDKFFGFLSDSQEQRNAPRKIFMFSLILYFKNKKPLKFHTLKSFKLMEALIISQRINQNFRLGKQGKLELYEQKYCKF